MYHKTDKKGRPIYIERIGQTDVGATFEVTTEERLGMHFIQEYELTMKLRYAACSAIRGEKIQTSLTIIDMTDGGISTANSQTNALFKMTAKIGQDFYPETMGNLFVVNAPFLFSGIWRIYKGFLNEGTRKKIKIIGGGFLPTLLEHADADNLPSFLGGNCTCPEVEGGCLQSYAGPWNDYELTPTGIEKKNVIQIEYEKT